MPTKTAMQQLIDYMESGWESDTNFLSMVLDFHKKALELRSVEREQIEDAHESGYSDGYNDNGTYGNDYYNRKYNLTL